MFKKTTYPATILECPCDEGTVLYAQIVSEKQLIAVFMHPDFYPFNYDDPYPTPPELFIGSPAKPAKANCMLCGTSHPVAWNDVVQRPIEITDYTKDAADIIETHLREKRELTATRSKHPPFTYRVAFIPKGADRPSFTYTIQARSTRGAERAASTWMNRVAGRDIIGESRNSWQVFNENRDWWNEDRPLLVQPVIQYNQSIPPFHAAPEGGQLYLFRLTTTSPEKIAQSIKIVNRIMRSSPKKLTKMCRTELKTIQEAICDYIYWQRELTGYDDLRCHRILGWWLRIGLVADVAYGFPGMPHLLAKVMAADSRDDLQDALNRAKGRSCDLCRMPFFASYHEWYDEWDVSWDEDDGYTPRRSLCFDCKEAHQTEFDEIRHVWKETGRIFMAWNYPFSGLDPLWDIEEEFLEFCKDTGIYHDGYDIDKYSPQEVYMPEDYAKWNLPPEYEKYWGDADWLAASYPDTQIIPPVATADQIKNR